MQFLTISRRRTESFTEEQFKTYAEPEAERVRVLYSQGILRQVWRRGDMPGACLLLEVADEQDARDAVASLPLMKAGMLELIAVVPLIPYPGFGPRQS
jgi:muconolactone delta-isomerase